MSVPTMPPGPATQSGNQGPYVGYPYGPPSTPAPMGSEPKKKSYAGLITGAIAGVAVVGLVAGGIGGAVGAALVDEGLEALRQPGAQQSVGGALAEVN